MKTFKEYSYQQKLDKYVSDEIKKRKLARHPVNATDDYKMKTKKNLAASTSRGSVVNEKHRKTYEKP